MFFSFLVLEFHMSVPFLLLENPEEGETKRAREKVKELDLEISSSSAFLSRKESEGESLLLARVSCSHPRPMTTNSIVIKSENAHSGKMKRSREVYEASQPASRLKKSEDY